MSCWSCSLLKQSILTFSFLFFPFSSTRSWILIPWVRRTPPTLVPGAVLPPPPLPSASSVRSSSSCSTPSKTSARRRRHPMHRQMPIQMEIQIPTSILVVSTLPRGSPRSRTRCCITTKKTRDRGSWRNTSRPRSRVKRTETTMSWWGNRKYLICVLSFWLGLGRLQNLALDLRLFLSFQLSL